MTGFVSIEFPWHQRGSLAGTGVRGGLMGPGAADAAARPRLGIARSAMARVHYGAWATQSGGYRLSSIGSRPKSVRSSGQSSAWAKRPSQSRSR